MQKDTKDIPSEWPGEDVIQRLVEFAAGSFIWAKMVVEMVKLDPVDRRLENILGGLGSIGNVDDLYGKMLFGALGHTAREGANRSRSILAAMVLAKNPLRTNDLVDLLSSADSSTDETPSIGGKCSRRAEVPSFLWTTTSYSESLISRSPISFSTVIAAHQQ